MPIYNKYLRMQHIREELLMFNVADTSLIADFRQNTGYQFLRETSDLLVFRSRKTGDIWAIKHINVPVYYPYLIFHSWKASDKMHQHYQTYSLEKALVSIADHEQWKNRIEKLM